MGERRVEGADVGEVWGGVSPSQPTIGCLGERRKLPQRGKRILVQLELEKTHLTLRNLIIFEPIHACNCKYSSMLLTVTLVFC